MNWDPALQQDFVIPNLCLDESQLTSVMLEWRMSNWISIMQVVSSYPQKM